MPDGINANENTGAKEYYMKMIDQLINHDITPMVTLYHWDLPSALYTEDCKGWICDDIIEHFGNYAKYCFETFGEKVKYWITLNEPAVFSDSGYEYW